MFDDLDNPLEAVKPVSPADPFVNVVTDDAHDESRVLLSIEFLAP